MDTLKRLDIDWPRALFLVDIEGGEFDLIDERLIALTRGSRFLIELHDAMPAVRGSRNKLLELFAQHWDCTVVADRARDWHDIEELRSWHDLDRAVLVSEGRKYLGEWLVCDPADR